MASAPSNENGSDNSNAVGGGGADGKVAVHKMELEDLDKTVFTITSGVLFIGIRAFAYPSILVKTRLQTDPRFQQVPSTINVYKEVVRADGFRGLFRGFAPSLLNTGLRQVYLLMYEEMRTQMKRFNDRYNWVPTDHVDLVRDSMSGFFASVAYQVISNPVDIVVQRMMVMPAPAPLQPGEKRTIMHRFPSLALTKQIYQADGLSAFYRGFVSSSMQYSLSSAIWWGTFAFCMDRLAPVPENERVKLPSSTFTSSSSSTTSTSSSSTSTVSSSSSSSSSSASHPPPLQHPAPTFGGVVVTTPEHEPPVNVHNLLHKPHHPSPATSSTPSTPTPTSTSTSTSPSLPSPSSSPSASSSSSSAPQPQMTLAQRAWAEHPWTAQHISAFAAGAASVAVTNPLDVCRTRLMVSSHRQDGQTFRTIFNRLIKEEGVGALMRGVVPRTIAFAPVSVMTMTVYQVSKLIGFSYKQGSSS